MAFRSSTAGWISIGRLGTLTGLSVSAIRFYEAKGLVSPTRDRAGRRHFLSSDVRRLWFVTIARELGCSLSDVKAYLDELPERRAPTIADWGRIGGRLRAGIEQRIARLTALREELDRCLECGCLSRAKCALHVGARLS
jgi:MerR family redox-sensitive transcriptional activator SoxR